MKRFLSFLTIALILIGSLFFNCECSKEKDDDKYVAKPKSDLLLTGKILEKGTQNAISGAAVRFYYQNGELYSPSDTVTDTQGNYSIPIDTSNTISELKVQANKEGYLFGNSTATISIEDNYAFVHNILLEKSNPISQSINPAEGGNGQAISQEVDDYIRIQIPPNSLPGNISSISIQPLTANEIPNFKSISSSEDIYDNSLPLSSVLLLPENTVLSEPAVIEFPLPYEAPESHEFPVRYYDRSISMWKILKDNAGNPIISSKTLPKKQLAFSANSPNTYLNITEFLLYSLIISGKIELGNFEYKDRHVIKQYTPNDNENIIIFDHNWTPSITFNNITFWFSNSWAQNLLSFFTGIDFTNEQSTRVNIYRPAEPNEPPEGDKYIWKVNVWWQTISIPFTITLGENTPNILQIKGIINIGSIYYIENYYEDEGSAN